MKRFFKSFSILCMLLVQSTALFAMSGITLPTIGDDKNLYELIGMDKAEYDRRRADAVRGIDALSDAQVEEKLKAIPQAEKLLKELQAAKQEKDRLERILSRDPLGAGLDLQTEGITVDQAQQRIAQFDVLLSQAKELIKQERYKGDFDVWAKREIISKCEEARKSLQKEVERIEQEMKFYPPEQAPRLQTALIKAQEKLKKLAEGCTFLVNPTFRAQYDAELGIESPTAFEDVKDAVESSMRLAGTGTRIKLNAIIGELLSRIEIPPVATKLFNQDLALTDVRVLPKPRGEDIKYYVGFTGTTVFNTFALTINVYVIWDIFNRVRLSVGISTPDNYRLTNMFPSLRALNWMLFPKGKFVAANFNGTDVDGYAFKTGLNFIAEWDIFSGPLAFFKKLQTAAPKLEGLVFEADPITVEVVIPKNPMFTELSAKVPIYIGVDFTKISKLPNAFTRVINKITIGGLELKISPSAPTLGRQEKRVTELKRKRDAAQAKLESAQRRARESGEFFVEGGDLHRAFEVADKAYQAEQKRVAGIREAELEKKLGDVEQEEEVVGIQSLFEEGGERRVQEFYEKATHEPIAGRKITPRTYREPVSPEQRAAAPGAAKQAALLEQFRKFGFTVEAQAEGVLKLGTQPDPIKLVVSGLVMPPGLKHPQGFISLAMRLENMLEFGWLAIGNAGIVVDIDVAAVEALIAFGIPISGVFINGQVDLGKPGESRASLKAGGGISITAKKPIDALIFDVSGENIRPTDFARFIGYQLMKSKYVSKGVRGLSQKGAQLYSRIFPKSGGVPSLSLPEIIFHKVWGYAALGAATIGKETYRSGLGLQVEIEIMKKKAGLKIFIGDQEKGYLLEGFGYTPPLSLSIKGRDLIKLYSAQDPAKGPYMMWSFNPKELFGVTPSTAASETLKARASAGLETFKSGAAGAKEDIIKGGSLSLDGVLELPMIGLKQKTKFSWAGYTIDADFETELSGYSLLFGVKLNTKETVFDESHYQQLIGQVRSLLPLKDPQDPRSVAAMLLLRAAQLSKTTLSDKLLTQALDILRPVQNKPKDTRSWRQIAKDVYAGGVSGVKELLFTVPEEIPREVIKQANELYKFRTAMAALEALKAEADSAKIAVPSPSNPILKEKHDAVVRALSAKDMDKTQEALNELRTALNEKVKDIRPDVGLKNWRGMNVKIGFKNKGELSKQISEQLVPYLNRLKESYTKRIAAIDAKVKRWEAGDIDPTKERDAIARQEAKISQMKAICSKRPYHIQIACQSKIKLEQSKLLKNKAILKAFIESKASKNIKRMAAIGYRKAKVGKALKAVGEKTLSALTATVQAIAKGIDILNIKELMVQWGYRDMVSLKLPRIERFIGEVTIMDVKVPIVLRDLQFDFKHPMRSVQAIAHAMMDVVHQTMQKEFLSDMPEEMQELLGEAIGM